MNFANGCALCGSKNKKLIYSSLQDMIVCNEIFACKGRRERAQAKAAKRAPRKENE